MSRILDRVRHDRPGHDLLGGGIEMDVIEEAMDPGPTPRSMVEAIDLWRATLAAVQANAKLLNSPSGFVTPPVNFPTLKGFVEDVRVTLHADPRAVTSYAIEHGLFAEDVRGLRVDPTTLRTHKTELSWDATLRTGPGRRRPATLRLAPSPSFHITVIRLTPVKGQRIATKAFIRSGLRAASELVRRLEDEV